MYAVVRETFYSPDEPFYNTEGFKEFDRKHSSLYGYRGSVVVEAEPGRFITLTLWQTREDLAAAREAMAPVVGQFLEPLMTKPAVLIGTGKVVADDLTN